jgi:hypothetical protein
LQVHVKCALIAQALRNSKRRLRFLVQPQQIKLSLES